MKMESNGMKSAGDKSRHINIRFFFIKDVLDREGIELLHCPTERTIADFYTTPLHGSLFKLVRNIIMGLTPFPDEERVGSKENVSKVASVKCGSTLSTATSNINTGTDHSRCTPKIVSYADVVRTG